MSMYRKIDEALTSAICRGVSTFAKLQADQGVSLEVERIVALHGGESSRYVDRRLQSLRRAGRVTYSRESGWAAGEGVAK